MHIYKTCLRHRFCVSYRVSFTMHRAQGCPCPKAIQNSARTGQAQAALPAKRSSNPNMGAIQEERPRGSGKFLTPSLKQV